MHSHIKALAFTVCSLVSASTALAEPVTLEGKLVALYMDGASGQPSRIVYTLETPSAHYGLDFGAQVPSARPNQRVRVQGDRERATIHVASLVVLP